MHNIHILRSDSREISVPCTSLCSHDNLFTPVVFDCCARFWFLLCDSGKTQVGLRNKTLVVLRSTRPSLVIPTPYFYQLLIVVLKKFLLQSPFCPFLHLFRTGQTSFCTSIYMRWTKIWHLSLLFFLIRSQGQIYANNLHLLRGAAPATPWWPATSATCWHCPRINVGQDDFGYKMTFMHIFCF